MAEKTNNQPSSNAEPSAPPLLDAHDAPPNYNSTLPQPPVPSYMTAQNLPNTLNAELSPIPPGYTPAPPPYSTTGGSPTGGFKPQHEFMTVGPDTHLPYNSMVTQDHRMNIPEFATFSEKSIRLAFVKKVFGILALQLILTGAIMCAFIFWRPLRDFAYTHNWMYIAALCVTFVLIIILGCVGNVRRKYPLNIILLLIYTLAMSWMLGSIAGRFKADEILMAVGIVAVITIAMTILGLQTKFDFTWLVGIISILTIVLICFGFLCLIVQDRYAYIAYASLGAFVFSMWLLIDIQMMMGGNHRYSIDPEEYIFAALNLYIDIVNIFLKILILIQASKQ